MNYLANVVRPAGDPRVLQQGPGSLTAIDRLGRALGWFSVGLGAVEMMAPGGMAQCLGLRRRRRKSFSAHGAREIGAGLLVLSVDRGVGLWGRVAGDVMDMAALMPAARRGNRRRGMAKLALATVAAITVLDVLAASGHAARHSRASGKPRLYGDRSGFPRGLDSARGAARLQIE